MRKLHIGIIVAVLVFVLLKGFSSFLSTGYGIGGILLILVCLIPLFFVYGMSQHAKWLGVLIGGLTWQYTIPILFLHGIEIGILMTICVAGLLAVKLAQTHQTWTSALDAWQSRAMLIVFMWISLRVLADPPGSIHAGGIGGAREAGVFVLGGLSFFLPKFLLSENVDMKLTRRTALYVAIGALLLHMGVTFSQSVGYGFRRLFIRSTWFLCAYGLAAVAESSWRLGSSTVRSWVAVGITLLLGALSPHRSRILFAGGIVGAVSYAYGRLSRNLLLLFCGLFVLGAGLAVTQAELPAPVARSLSIMFPRHASKAHDYIRAHHLSDEVGWNSPFRGVLLKMAGRTIRRRPFVGKGFTFSMSEYWVAYHKRNTMEAEYQVLAATGAYHNSLVELAVACGVPIVALFCLVYIGVLIPFAKRLKSASCSDTRVLFVGILGLFLAESGQVLMNGGSQDFYIVSLLLGVMHYSRFLPGMKPAGAVGDDHVEEVERVGPFV